MDGFSVLPSLLGQPQNPCEYLYCKFYNPFQQTIRIDNWKGIRLGIDEKIHLFDLNTDVKEENNVAVVILQWWLVVETKVKFSSFIGF